MEGVHKKTIRKVIACPACNGIGSILVDPGDRGVKYTTKECKACKGKGRLIRITTIDYSPLIDNESVLMIRL